MGYTHYFEIDIPLGQNEVAAFATDVHDIVLASELPIAGWDGTGGPQYTSERVSLNGAEPESCETFMVVAGRGGFDFCKTRRLPYDVVVTAALLVLRDRYPSSVRLSSDGDPSDWEPGRELAQRALHRSIKGL